MAQTRTFTAPAGLSGTARESRHRESDMQPKITVLACQITIEPVFDAASRDRQVARICREIAARLDHRRADLVVLPELTTIDYSVESFACLPTLAEAAGGESARQFAALAARYRCSLVFGLPTCHQEGFRISQVVLDHRGSLLGVYHKLHSAHYGASMEKDWFVTGDRALTFDCRGVRYAPIICYDIRFPELTRSLVLDGGTELLVHSGAYYRDESFDSWEAFVVTRAMENQIFLLSLNRAGEHYGRSMFAAPWVDRHSPLLVFDEHRQDLRYLEIDTTRIHQMRQQYTFLLDRKSAYPVEVRH